MAGSRKAYERLGAKVLSLPDVVAQSVGFMGPVFSAAFVIPLVIGVASASGRGGGIATPLSVLIAAVGVFGLGWIVSRYAKEIHSAGSLYDYVSRGLGERIGVGFETAANLAEETKNPKREIPVAVLTTAGIATVFFVLAAYVEVAGFNYDLKAIAQAAGAPLFALGAPESAGGYGGVWIDRLLELVVLFDIIAVAIGCAVASSRGVFAMARDRRLPASLAVVSKNHGTPFGATVFVIAASLATLAVNQWTNLFALPGLPHYFALFAWGSTFGGFALVVVYLLMSVGSLRNFGTAPGRGALIVAALIGIVITAGAIFVSFYKVQAPTIYAPWGAVGLFVVGLLIAFVLPGRQAARRELADLGSKSTA
jgi:amino acid transporter